MTVEYRRRPAITNEQLGDLLESGTAPADRCDYQQILSRSLTWIGAFDDDRLVGYANVAWDGGVHAFLLDPTVHLSQRGRGIGTRLVEEALAAVAEHPQIKWVHVDSSEDLMKRFYFPAGFRPTPAGLVWVQDIRDGKLSMTRERVAVEVRRLDDDGVRTMTAAFCGPPYNKSPDQYPRYLEQQEAGEIDCLVAYTAEGLAGYLKVVWSPGYLPLRHSGIPEIQDLNVLTEFRRRGVASRLLDRAEAEVAQRSPAVGIGVGLHSGYNAAQRLYVIRGYVPDGLGVTYNDRPVVEGEALPFDDELVLHFTKEL